MIRARPDFGAFASRHQPPGVGLLDTQFEAASTIPVGAQGQMTLKVALVKSKTDKIKKVPGITNEIDVRIVDAPRPNTRYEQFHLVRLGGAK